ncbi:uncharacterized protein FIBRA_00293 [Fibroporia radiculosa]|uniref:TM7S3/TM198-like domain-containing protein n=1 Tax=Fibroporia radiculosa TaxID=599839 RepID=J7S5Y2_9APHY|nr:uncharacterized protein FIBRA_00293 [Fibroporia radiculosa]CCL98299.1 predicted protein [Fibroporia radiculosa]
MVAVIPSRWFSALWPCLLVVVCLSSAASAASPTSTSPTSSSTTANSTVTPAPTSYSLATSYVTIATTILSNNQNISVSTVLPVVYNATVTSNTTANASQTTNGTTASGSATPTPIVLDTTIDPAFGVLGALLILTGLPCVFLGHKNRWTSFFLIGVYSFALVCLVLILRFGVLEAVNPPSKTVRGLFVLACGVAGIAGGGIAIFFWQATKFFIGAWGGFVVALWIQCFKAGGLISPIGFRWILYIIVAAIGFILCTIPKIHYHILLLSTAFVGATSLILGIDCYTTGGLKEFYMWNLGFTSLFPKYTDNGIKFPITQTMEIELGLMGAVSLMGIAVQFQVFNVLRRKLKEIQAQTRQQDEEAEKRAALGLADMVREKEEWERDHPTLLKHGRKESGFSSLMKDGKDGDRLTPSTDDHRASTLIDTPRERYQSGVSDFLAAARPSEDMNRSVTKLLQSPGALPVLDLGTDIETDVPQGYIADSDDSKVAKSGKGSREKGRSTAEMEDIKRKEELLAEIQTIRRSIEVLKSETPDPSSSSNSRHPSFTSRRTLSYELGALSPAPQSHLRPPRQMDPRARVQSMDMSNLSRLSDIGASIGRPTSAPLRDDDWDSYVRDRKLLQPPSGVTAPIPTTPISPSSVPVSPAIEEALKQRQLLESAITNGAPPEVSPRSMRDALPVQKVSSGSIPAVLRPPQHTRSQSHGGLPVTILPPRKLTASPTPEEPEVTPWTTRTYEELVERHREKMKELQSPLTRAEQEQVQIQEAKSRWERARQAEKQAVAKRQAEKAAAYSKEEGKHHKTSDQQDSSKRKSRTLLDQNGKDSSHPPSRPLSANVLASVPGTTSSKRMSMLKVEDWQKHQQDVEMGFRPDEQRRSSRSNRPSDVPFPETHGRPVDSRDKRRMSHRGALPRND